MSEAVAVYQSNTDIVRQAISDRELNDLMGISGLERSDISMPRVSIRQPTSKFGEPKDAGHFHNSVTEEFKAEMRVVVLRVTKGRVMWSAEFDGSASPRCASDDNKMPREGNGLTDPQPGPCASCEYAQWGDGHEPPACSLVYTYLCADMSDDSVFMLSAMRTSARAAKKLNTSFGQWKLSREHVLKTKLEKGDQGQWYELVAVAGEQIPPEKQVELIQKLRGLKDLVMTVDTETGLSDLDASDYAPGAEVIDAEPLAF